MLLLVCLADGFACCLGWFAVLGTYFGLIYIGFL